MEFISLTFCSTIGEGCIPGEHIFAGGAVTATNKPEEATRFGLKVVSHTDKIQKALGPDVSLPIGINPVGHLSEAL
jgi:hypothetical protein